MVDAFFDHASGMSSVFASGGRAARAHQHFEHGVECGGIRAARLDDRLDVVAVPAEELRRHLELVVLHPVDVALQRVDLAIVREHAEGLGEPPCGEGVRRIALVEDGEGRDETLVFEIGIEIRELFGEEHALVDERPRRQRADVEILNGRFAHALLDAPPAEIKPALELFHIELVAHVEHDLFDLRTRGVGLLADDGDVDRHLPPAIEIEAEAQDFGFDDGAAGFLRVVIRARQEDLADADGAALELCRSARYARGRNPAAPADGCPRRRPSCRRHPPRRDARPTSALRWRATTTSRRGLPSMAATRPTPQASCS